MKAAVLDRHADPRDEPFSIRQVADPELDRADDVVVEIAGAGYCRTDNKLITGEKSTELAFPHVLGHENAGFVTDVGSDVTRFAPGDAVLCHSVVACGRCEPCRRRSSEVHCREYRQPGITGDGGFAEYLRTNERALVGLSGGDPADFAPCSDAGVTAYHAARKASRWVGPTDVVVVVGVGNLGYVGVQCLDILTEAYVVAADLSTDALERAHRAGADAVVDVRDADLCGEVDAITDGTGARCVLDFAGKSDHLDAGPAMLDATGRYVVVGYGEEITLPSNALVTDEISYVGSRLGSVAELRDVAALVERGRVDLNGETFPLEAVNSVARRVDEGSLGVRPVLTP